MTMYLLKVYPKVIQGANNYRNMNKPMLISFDSISTMRHLTIAFLLCISFSSTGYSREQLCNPIHFDFGSTELKESGTKELDSLFQILRQHPSWQIKIVGHNCYKEVKLHKDSLSLKRALTAYEYLMRQGIYQDRIIYNGLKDGFNIIPKRGLSLGVSKEQLRPNRRIEFHLVSRKFTSKFLRFKVHCHEIRDRSTGLPMEGVRIEMTGSDGSDTVTWSDKNGGYSFDLRPNTNYEFTFCKVYHNTEMRKLTTQGMSQSANLELCVSLDPGCGFIILPQLNFKFRETTLSPENKKMLDQFLPVLITNPTMVFEFTGHSDYLEAKIDIPYDSLRASKVIEYLISKGIDTNRLELSRQGDTEPVKVPERMAGYRELEWDKEWPLPFEGGVVLTEAWIKEHFKINSTSWKNAMQKNRRVEISIVRMDFIPPGGKPKSDTGCQ